jgi:hypothetical protein
VATQLSPQHRQHLIAAKIEAAYFLAVVGLYPSEDEILDAEASFHQRFGDGWGRAFYACVEAEMEKARSAWHSPIEEFEPRPTA